MASFKDSNYSVLCDKIKGVVFGAALGDAVGLAAEFMSKDRALLLYENGPIKFGKAEGHEFWRDGHRSKWHENDFTDDTDQLLLVLQCLLNANGQLVPQHFGFRLKEWEEIGFPELSNKPPFGIGLTVGSTLSHPEFLQNPHKASYDVWNRNGTRSLAANGAVMRTSVLGVPYFWNEEEVVKNSINCSKITHADPRCVFSSVVVSVLISRVLNLAVPSSSSLLSESGDGQGSSKQADIINLMESGANDEDTASISPVKPLKLQPKTITSRPEGNILQKGLQSLKNVFKKDESPQLRLQMWKLNLPPHNPPDGTRLQQPATHPKVYSPSVTLVDDHFGKMTQDVVEKYTFLLTDSKKLSPENEEKERNLSDLKTFCTNFHSVSLQDLKLDDRISIGYTFKCLGAGLFSLTRKIPDHLQPSEFFKHLITDLTLEAGDADTNCAVAGSLLGCRLEYSNLPTDWLQGLRHSSFLHEACDSLCQLVLGQIEETNNNPY